MTWPTDPDDLETLQRELAVLSPPTWAAQPPLVAGGCFVCFGRGGAGPGAAGDEAWAAAARVGGHRLLGSAVIEGEAGAPYAPGLLAAREGALLEAAVQALPQRPEVLLVNATGRDHPHRAGLALHLGWALDLPTVGITHRPLVAAGDAPGPVGGAVSPLRIGEDHVGWWVRTRTGVRPLAVSPGWCTDLATALDVVRLTTRRVRTPVPLRQARRLARTARGRHPNR